MKITIAEVIDFNPFTWHLGRWEMAVQGGSVIHLWLCSNSVVEVVGWFATGDAGVLAVVVCPLALLQALWCFLTGAEQRPEHQEVAYCFGTK